MGRGKFNMELISNEKTRMATYHKRKKGLKKKVYELSTLCDVETCMIIYGPKQKDHPRDFATWPESQEKLRRIISHFKVKGAHRNGSHGISRYFIDRKKNIDKEISRNRMKSCDAIFQPWDQRFDGFSEAQVSIALALLEAKLEEAQRKLDCMVKNATALRMMGAQGMLQKSMEVEAMNLQPISCLKPLDYLEYPLLPLDFNPLKVEDGQDYYAGFGGMYSSDIVQYTPLNGPMYYDPTVNNPLVVPPMYDYNPTMPLMLPNQQYPMMQTVSDQMDGFELMMKDMIER
ncbi:floral homeotic protein FBP1-like [Corylus avellana]|uniref:floral homeotic protein FBP1-like n=1 Tax=Corylus avellana TaxID=13451 RepID=UPI001E22F951|nr:floral homeotic protein FBP1-like [Corylus avellana]